jgi:O-antigen ligase
LDCNLGNSVFLLCAICFIPITFYSYFHIYDIAVLGLFICFVPFIIFQKRHIFLTSEHLVFLAIILWTIVSYMLSSDQKGFHIAWNMYILPCMLFYLLTQLMTEKNNRSFTTGVLIIGILISSQLIISMIILYFRSGGSFDLHLSANIYWARSNYIAALLELPILWLFDLIENKNTRKRKYIVVFSLCFFALILTVSRGGILTIMLSMLLYIILKGSRFSTSFIVLIVFSFIYIFFTKSISHRFLHMVDQGNISRIYLWLQSIELILKHPILGYGPGNIQLWANFLDTTHKMPGPHNIILEVMLHIGIGGFLLCAVLFFMLIRKAFLFYKTDKEPIYLILIFASLSHSMIEPTFLGYQYSFIFWYFMSHLTLQSKIPLQLYKYFSLTWLGQKPGQFSWIFFPSQAGLQKRP